MVLFLRLLAKPIYRKLTLLSVFFGVGTFTTLITIQNNFSILKFEERTAGNKALLIVKNITQADFCQFTAEARGEQCSAKLTEQSPFVGKVISFFETYEYTVFDPVSEIVFRWTASPVSLVISKFSWFKSSQAPTSAGSLEARKSASKISGTF